MQKLAPKSVFVLFSILLAASAIYRGVIAYYFDIGTMYTADAPVWEPVMQWIYVKPFSRAGSYVLGMVVGYYRAEIVAAFEKAKFRSISNKLAAMLATWAFFAGVFEGFHNYFHQILYIALFRIIFAFAVSLLIISCFSGRHETLKDFMSAPAWRKISKYSYGTYLVHPLITGLLLHVCNYAHLDLTVINVDILLLFLSVIVAILSILTATVLYRFVEEPAMKLRNFLK